MFISRFVKLLQTWWRYNESVRELARLNDRERNILLFQLGVWRAESADELSASHLTPDQIVGVIHDLHLVGLGVADPELNRVSSAASLVRGHVGRIDKFAAMRCFVKPVPRR